MTDAKTEREADRQLEVMAAGCVDFIGREQLRERLVDALTQKRPLRFKLGMDPSSPDLHLGHTVVLNKLRRIQELGHTPIFLIGDFTARIGDPSGKNKTRPALDAADVARNATTYTDQVSRILDVERAEVRFNSEWMEELSSSDLVRLCSHYTVARLLERDDFSKRYKGGAPIAVHEFLYPFVQAYDSVALSADVEIGGTDQTFNLLMGREIQRDYGQSPQAVMTHPLLVGTDGVKMSKSLGNGIGITDVAEEMFGKAMRISDTQMIEYFDLLDDDRWPELRAQRPSFDTGEGDAMRFKLAMARAIVERFHGSEAGEAAANHFHNVIQRKRAPANLDEVSCSIGEDGDIGLLALLEQLGLVPSRSEARRLVGQKAVRIDDDVVQDPKIRLKPGSYLLRVGKRRFAQVRLTSGN
jgi:tyrosyl-tRNA synthetase